jgi:protein Mpv17
MGFMMGPLNHAWYTTLDRFLPAITGKTVIKKIFLDQIIASPVFACSFFMGMGTMEGHHVKESWSEFTSKFWDVYKVGPQHCVSSPHV